MDQIITLSTLLAGADSLLEKLRSRQPYQLHTPEQRRAFNEQYERWCTASRTALPDDLRAHFEHELSRLPAPPDPQDERVWEYYSSLPFSLEQQRQQLFLARRRLWKPASRLPKEARTTIATVCKKSYAPYTIDSLFIASGCEQHWYIPHTQRDSGAKTMNIALGWLDGILLYAPEQEISILHNLCDAILQNPRLNSKYREQIEQILPLFEPSADVFTPVPLHPTVQALAAPLLAANLDDVALEKVCAALSNEVQRRTGRTAGDNTQLMQMVFSKDKPLITCSSHPTEQQGWMFMFSAVFMSIRNPVAHGKAFSINRDHTLEWLTFLSALFYTLDRSS